MTDHDMIESWRADASSPSPEGITATHSRFARRVALRNMREWAAAAIVVLFFSARAVTARQPLVQVGAALTVVSALFVSVVLVRRGRVSHSPSPDAPTTEHLAHHAAELARQARLLRVAWAWYLAPFVPGVLLMVFGSPSPPLMKGVVLGVSGIVFLGIAVFNGVAASKLERSAAAFRQ